MKSEDCQENLESSKLGAIYCIYCLITKKYYIGSTSQYPYEDRMYGRLPSSHKNRSEYDESPLYEDMRLYGLSNFEFKILEEVDKSQLRDAEYRYIEKFIRDYGKESLYNRITYDGEQFQTPEVRQKILDSIASRTPEERSMISQKRVETCRELYGERHPYNTPEAHDKSVKTQLEMYGSYKNHPMNSEESAKKATEHSRRSRCNILEYDGMEFEGIDELTEYLQTEYPGISRSSVTRISHGTVVKRYKSLYGKIRVITYSCNYKSRAQEDSNIVLTEHYNKN